MEQMPKLEDIRFRKVLCAIDLGDQTSATVYWANRFASEMGADLEITHAISDGDAVLISEEDLIQAATAKIAAIQAAVGSKGRISVIAGEVSSAICDHANRGRADLLVIGRSVHEGVLGRLRANAYSIIRQSPCPVVSI